MATLLVQWLVSGTAIALAASLAIQLVPAGAAAERHRLWWAALLAVVALPFLPFVVWPVSSPVGVESLARGAAVAGDAALVSLAPPSWLAPLLAGAWVVWSCIALARISASVVAINRLVASSTAMPDDGVAGLAGRVRGARVWCAPGLRGACAVGYFRPSIVVGSDMPTRLDGEALRLVVLHEAAHLARYDDWTRLARQLIVAAAGFHPAVWFIARQIDHECELACDQWVVARTGSPERYARALVTVAEVASDARRSYGVLAPGVLARPSRLRQRVARLLAGTAVPRAVRLVRATVGAGILGLAALLTASIPPIVGLVAGPPPRVLASLPPSAGLRSVVPDVVSRRPAVPAAQPIAVQSSGLPVEPTEHVPPTPAVLTSSGGSAEPAASDNSARSADVLPEAPRLVHTVVVPAGIPETASGEASLGARASRAGLATGDVAGRVGQSIGRFFSRGGRAVSNRF